MWKSVKQTKRDDEKPRWKDKKKWCRIYLYILSEDDIFRDLPRLHIDLFGTAIGMKKAIRVWVTRKQNKQNEIQN